MAAAAASSSWMDDRSLGGATDVSRISGVNTGPTMGKIRNRKAKLEAELKLLEWHKMANEAALKVRVGGTRRVCDRDPAFFPLVKAALLQTKSIKETASPLKASAASFAADDEKWIRKVIEEEQVKPLEVSRDFVLDYEKKEKQNAERLSQQVHLRRAQQPLISPLPPLC